MIFRSKFPNKFSEAISIGLGCHGGRRGGQDDLFAPGSRPGAKAFRDRMKAKKSAQEADQRMREDQENEDRYLEMRAKEKAHIAR